MESLEEKIRKFLEICSSSGFGSGSGSGSGSGFSYGYGDGSGSGSGFGSGFGSGSGSGSSSGFGSGSGSGSSSGYGDGLEYNIISICGKRIYYIDFVPTIITIINGNIAKGKILNSDLTTTDCFIYKQDNIFAHGETVKKAMAALQRKLFDNMSEEERIEKFLAEHKKDKKYPAKDFYEWHHFLTGSCEMGRDKFVKNHGINLEKDEFTIKEFIDLTKNNYGGDIIRKIDNYLKNGVMKDGNY